MVQLSSKQKALLFDCGITTGVFVVMVIVFFLELLQGLDWKLYDLLVNIHRKTPVQKENVVIITIDDRSLRFYSDQEPEIGWPWPRDFHGALTRYLSDAGAKAVVYDVFFFENDSHGEFGETYDADFGNAIASSGVTYLAVSSIEDEAPVSPHENVHALPNDDGRYDQLNIKPYNSGTFPIDVLAQDAKGLGFAIFNEIAEVDGIFRRYPAVVKVRDKYYDSLGTVIVRDIAGSEAVETIEEDRSAYKYLLDDKGCYLLNWYGRGGEKDGVFTYYSYHGVLSSYIAELRGEKPIVPPESFKDKIVLIGSTAAGLFDIKPTPFRFGETSSSYPGVEIHATAIENYLANDFIYRVHAWLVTILMIVVSFSIFLSFRIFKKLRYFIISYSFIIAIEIVAAYIMIAGRTWLPWMEVLVTTSLVFFSLVLSGYFRESKGMRILRKSFEQYVNDSVLTQILENPGTVDFGGNVVNATILATDIAGFTTISEEMLPHEVVTRLNEYLSDVSESLIDDGAYINKYIGDAILAVFGAFGSKNHSRAACLAGVKAMKIIDTKIREAKEKGIVPFVTRMGITTGEMTMGNIGSKRKVEYTVIGDSVNSAFRLEGVNKFYNTHILVNETTHNNAGDEFECRMIDTVLFKGKDNAVRIYELLGLKGEVDDKKLRCRDEFEGALVKYCEGDFPAARSIFERLAEEGDDPSKVFKSRCDVFIEKPPMDAWAGVWKMYAK